VSFHDWISLKRLKAVQNVSQNVLFLDREFNPELPGREARLLAIPSQHSIGKPYVLLQALFEIWFMFVNEFSV
jgi:hypothetical protein